LKRKKRLKKAKKDWEKAPKLKPLVELKQKPLRNKQVGSHISETHLRPWEPRNAVSKYAA
jgi:hypothetical protein